MLKLVEPGEVALNPTELLEVIIKTVSYPVTVSRILPKTSVEISSRC